MHVFNESNVFILFHFLWGCYGGALVFLGGEGAPASPSLAPPMLSIDMRTRMKPIVYIINNSLTLKYIENMETLDLCRMREVREPTVLSVSL